MRKSRAVMHDAYIFTKHGVSFYVTEADILLGDELSDSDGELRFTFGPLKMKRALRVKHENFREGII